MQKQYISIRKVVVNHRLGGHFQLSKKAIAWLKDQCPSVSEDQWQKNKHFRTHPLLIECVLTMGKSASTSTSDLVCMNISEGVRYHIEEVHGYEALVTPDAIKWDRVWAW